MSEVWRGFGIMTELKTLNRIWDDLPTNNPSIFVFKDKLRQEAIKWGRIINKRSEIKTNPEFMRNWDEGAVGFIISFFNIT
jgi:hypothetical protein